jgi:signal transduction histidine kinase
MTVVVGDRRASGGLLARLFGVAMDMLGRRFNLAATVRAKILLGFVLMATMTCLLGLAGMNSIGDAGSAVAENFNRPLAAISYARVALARFTEMQTRLTRQLSTGPMRPPLDFQHRMDVLAKETATYLRLAVSYDPSSRTIAAARQAAANVALWDAKRRALFTGEPAPNGYEDTLRLGDTVLGNFEHLVELTAEDGLIARQHAMDAIARYRQLTLMATLLALVIGAIVTFVLMRLVAAKQMAQSDLAAAIESAPAAMILVNGKGKVSVANSQALNYFSDHARGLSSGTPFSLNLANAFAEPAGELKLDDGRWIKLSRRQTEDGGFVAVAADITMLKDRERALIAARDVAEAASRAKGDFLANMSHELRTPLNAVIGFSEMIAEEMLGPVGQVKYMEFAGDILFSGRHLLQIINHVLDIAKLQWGKMAIERKPVRLGDVIAEAMRITRAQALSGGVALDMHVDGAVPTITGDATRLRQIVLNLLSNAIKFTPAGGRVDVEMRCREGEVEVAVRDTGIGMDQADIPKAMEPFEQADSTIARKYGGTGLGLPLCKLFVELHGGTMAIASAPGQGTTVTVTLPAAVTAR